MCDMYAICKPRTTQYEWETRCDPLVKQSWVQSYFFGHFYKPKVNKNVRESRYLNQIGDVARAVFIEVIEVNCDFAKQEALAKNGTGLFQLCVQLIIEKNQTFPYMEHPNYQKTVYSILTPYYMSRNIVKYMELACDIIEVDFIMNENGGTFFGRNLQDKKLQHLVVKTMQPDTQSALTLLDVLKDQQGIAEVFAFIQD